MNEVFEREKVCYEQNYLQFRSLNQIMWQVPIIAMTLTGGLWFGVSKMSTPAVQISLLILAFVGNIGLTFVLIRIRYVMREYLCCLKQFHPPGYVEASGDSWFTHSERVVGTFKALLLFSAFICFVGILIVAFIPEWISLSQSSDT